MVSFRRLASVTSLLSTLALGSSAVALAAPEAAPSADMGAHHGHHGRRGDLLRASLRLDSLSTSQRQQIEGLVAQEKAAHGNVAAARSQLLQALAGSVAAGSVDDVALAPDVHAVEGAIQADEPADRAALEKLHGILTPAQRVELVTRIESHTHSHSPGHGAGEHASAGDGGAGPRMGRGEGAGMWGHALNLSDAQKQQIEVNLRSIGPTVDRSVWKQERETRENVLAAFKGDQFVMNRVAPPRDPRLIDAEAERIVRMAKASAPVLTPEQRATAAAKLRDFAAHAGGRK